MTTRFGWLALALAFGVLSGCGEAGPKKAHVSGTVQMDGKPLDQGEIYFMVPSGGKPPEVLPVTNGKFDGEVTLGTKRIEIHSPLKVPLKPGEVPMGPPPVYNRVHEDYNVNSKLTAEVSESGLSPSNFDVKKNRDVP